MKRLLALMMALAIVATFAACTGKEEPKNDQETKPVAENTETVTDTEPEQTETGSAEVEETEDATEPEDTMPDNTDSNTDHLIIDENTAAVEVLEFMWNAMGAEHQPASYGGHFSEEMQGGPYTYDLTYAEDLAATLLLPENQMDKVTDAATVVHMLNANSMTTGVLKMKEGTDVKAFAKAVSERISGNRWMCGFPEKMAVIQINEDFLFVAYGLAELVDPMINGMDNTWTVSELYNQPLE